jgi:hypothetical protein
MLIFFLFNFFCLFFSNFDFNKLENFQFFFFFLKAILFIHSYLSFIIFFFLLNFYWMKKKNINKLKYLF